MVSITELYSVSSENLPWMVIRLSCNLHKDKLLIDYMFPFHTVNLLEEPQQFSECEILGEMSL